MTVAEKPRYNPAMFKKLIFSLVLPAALPALAAGQAEESDIKFALYSPAWGENAEDDLRLLVHNQTGETVRLERITFLRDTTSDAAISLEPGLTIPPAGYAEAELDYVDLLSGDECVEQSLSGNWKLAEISNYTLNPSVRNLIIEDTDSFRIYQCVQTVITTWTELETGATINNEEWVLYHFESRQN